MEFANKSIENIFNSALDMTHSKCDGCDTLLPLHMTKAWGYEYFLCATCREMAKEGRLSFSKDERDEVVYCKGQDDQCPNIMATSRYRTIDGVTTCTSQAREYCLHCTS